MIYVEFFHGRREPGGNIEELGFLGPILGPLSYCLISYGTHINIGSGVLYYTQGFIKCCGSYYSDMSIFDRSFFKNNKELKSHWKLSQKILLSKEQDWPLLLHDENEWVRIYAEQRLKGGNNYDICYYS